MKNVSTTHFSFVFSKFFSLWREQFLCGVGDREPAQPKVTVEKTPKRAAATPPFLLLVAQKVSGLAPVLPHGKLCRLLFSRDRPVGIKTHHEREEANVVR